MNNAKGPIILDNGLGTPANPGAYFAFGQATPTTDADSTGPRWYAGTGNPNGILVAPLGSLWTEIVTAVVYENTDGVVAWTAVIGGGGGGGGAVLIYDSGYLGAPAASLDTGPFAMPAGTEHLSFKLVSRTVDAGETYQHIQIELNADGGAGPYQSTRMPDDPIPGLLTAPIARLPGSAIVGSTPCDGTFDLNEFGILNGNIDFNSGAHYRQVVTVSADHRSPPTEENIADTTVEWANVAVVTQIAFRPVIPGGGVSGAFDVGSRLMVYATS